MKRGMEEYVLRAVERMVRIDVKRERLSWPPPCPLFSHQPKRPDVKMDNN